MAYRGCGDFDHDGKIDLMLGDFSVAPSFSEIKNQLEGKVPSFMILNEWGKIRGKSERDKTEEIRVKR
jgi:hypothetical protein